MDQRLLSSWFRNLIIRAALKLTRDLHVDQENENILVSACGDGSVKIWDVQAPPHANPLRSFEEHTREVGLSSLYFFVLGRSKGMI